MAKALPSRLKKVSNLWPELWLKGPALLAPWRKRRYRRCPWWCPKLRTWSWTCCKATRRTAVEKPGRGSHCYNCFFWSYGLIILGRFVHSGSFFATNACFFPTYFFSLQSEVLKGREKGGCFFYEMLNQLLDCQDPAKRLENKPPQALDEPLKPWELEDLAAVVPSAAGRYDFP